VVPAVTHPIVDDLTGRVQAVAHDLATSIRYATEPQATAVLVCFVAKLRGVAIADDLSSVVDEVPLEELVTAGALPYWRTVFDDADDRAEWVRRLRNFQVPIPRVRPREDGSLVIPLGWVHPDQDEPLMIDTPRQMTVRLAYLWPNEDGAWRFDQFALPADTDSW
jgi:hypothetical protein